MKRTITTALLSLAISLIPLGASSPAFACPDPENPCDIQPYEVPGWCKLTPFC